MTDQEFYKEFYKDADKRLGVDKPIPRVAFGRYALFLAFGRGVNPYLSPAQMDDLKDFSHEELIALMRKPPDTAHQDTPTTHTVAPGSIKTP